MNASSPNSLITATIEPLRKHAPFSEMVQADLLWLAQRLTLAYFAQNTSLLEPGDRAPQALYIVKQGVVQGETADGTSVLQLGLGEVSRWGRFWPDVASPIDIWLIAIPSATPSRPPISIPFSNAARRSGNSAPTALPACWSSRKNPCKPNTPPRTLPRPALPGR